MVNQTPNEVNVAAIERPHSMSYTKTAKDGWRPDGLKIYYDAEHLDLIIAEGRDRAAIELMAAMDATARAGNGWDVNTREETGQ